MGVYDLHELGHEAHGRGGSHGDHAAHDALGRIDLLLVLAMWAIMMAAMMLPSTLPMVLSFAFLSRQRRAQCQSYVHTSVFVLGYLAVWSAFGPSSAVRPGLIGHSSGRTTQRTDLRAVVASAASSANERNPKDGVKR